MQSTIDPALHEKIEGFLLLCDVPAELRPLKIAVAAIDAVGAVAAQPLRATERGGLTQNGWKARPRATTLWRPAGGRCGWDRS